MHIEHLQPGTTIGQLTILATSPRKQYSTGKSKNTWRWQYQCRCTCGKTVWVNRASLMAKNIMTNSCGCRRRNWLHTSIKQPYIPLPDDDLEDS